MKTLSPEQESLDNQPGGPNPACVTRKCDNEGMSLLLKEFACNSYTGDTGERHVEPQKRVDIFYQLGFHYSKGEKTRGSVYSINKINLDLFCCGTQVSTTCSVTIGLEVAEQTD